MAGIITFVHITACVLLVIIILLQQSKGDGMGSAFGGGGSQSVLGARGAATVIAKLTTILAITFMVTSLTLAYFSSKQSTNSLLSTPVDKTLEEPSLQPEEEAVQNATEETEVPAEDTGITQPLNTADQ